MSPLSTIITPVSEPSRPLSALRSYRRRRRIHPPEGQIVATSAPSTLTLAPHPLSPCAPCDATCCPCCWPATRIDLRRELSSRAATAPAIGRIVVAFAPSSLAGAWPLVHYRPRPELLLLSAACGLPLFSTLAVVPGPLSQRPLATPMPSMAELIMHRHVRIAFVSHLSTWLT